MKGMHISDRCVVIHGIHRETKGGYFTEFEYDRLDAYVLGKGNVYDHLRAGWLYDITRFIVVRPYLIVHA